MEAYKYLVTLGILLLVNNSFARPEQSLANTSISKFPALVLPKINDIAVQNDYANCTGDHADGFTSSNLTTSLLKLGDKTYYFETIMKANWFKALLYCRSHNMHLVSIGSQELNDRLEKQIKDLDRQEFWTSGTDLPEEGTFFWMANGRQITFTNWLSGEPNNSRDINEQGENCLHVWRVDGIGWKWNDAPCDAEKNFICEGP